MSQPWWSRPFRTVQTNIREIDAGLDVEKALDFIEDYGADTWLLSTGGIIANYPSVLKCQSVNPTLVQRPSGDLIGDAVTAAAERGIRVLSRMDFSKIDARRAEEHPEWCFVTAEGRQQVYNGYRSTCPSAGYYQQAMFDVVTEVLQNYPVSGFFFNMMHFNERDYSRTYWGACHCAACLAGFQDHTPGAEHPTSPESASYPAWQKYASDVLSELNHRMQDHISGINPDVALILGDKAHITYYEANNAAGRPLWHYQTSESVSAARSEDPQRTVFTNSTAFFDMPYRWAGEDPDHFNQYLIQSIAHGGSPSTYIMGTPQTTQYQNLTSGREITRFHRDHAETYAGMESSAGTALIRSHNPNDPHADRRRSEFRGCYQSLVEEHLPFDVVDRKALPNLDPHRYRTIILPDIGALTGCEAQKLNTALAQGTHIIATGDSAFDGPHPQLAPQSPVATRKATYTTETDLYSLHIPPPPPHDHIPVLGAFEVLEPSIHAATEFRALSRAPYGPPEKCYGHQPTNHPAITQQPTGEGHLTHIALRPGHIYHDTGITRARNLITDHIHTVTTPQLTTDLPPQTHLTLAKNTAGETLIHIINTTGYAPQKFHPPLLIPPSQIHLHTSTIPTHIHALTNNTALNWTTDNNSITIHTPQIKTFEAIRMTYSN
ncbi:alpha-amylase family protein [Nesterenkonia ebinurensis]|uniref:alpha-amylase family protein n=1 Tax=Nesterenkonia ebinurensis TaxID=2608252 RepID=UPI00168B544E|nr:alpha-amylase family protein [Nesterenkonia ebinurensis]